MASRNVLFVAVGIIGVLAVAIVYYQQVSTKEPILSEEGEIASLNVTSTAFDDGGQIPGKYTCDGEDVSPPLSWSGAPGGTRSYALIVEDPDAPLGVFTHWVVFNLPAEAEGLPEGVPNEGALEGGGFQGTNGFGSVGYGGPCPPRGSTHRYRFHIYALDESLDLRAGASKSDLLEAIKGHVLAEGEITGIYGRP